MNLYPHLTYLCTVELNGFVYTGDNSYRKSTSRWSKYISVRSANITNSREEKHLSIRFFLYLIHIPPHTILRTLEQIIVFLAVISMLFLWKKSSQVTYFMAKKSTTVKAELCYSWPQNRRSVRIALALNLMEKWYYFTQILFVAMIYIHELKSIPFLAMR